MTNINEVILQQIDKYCQAKNKAEGRRTHLGASIIGQECPRQTWYGFRWVKEEEHSGQTLRLFARGHLEEHRFVEYLRGIGFKVWDVDEDGNQFRISDVMGHFGGSCDGFCFAPEWLLPQLPPGFTTQTPILTEYKTSGENAFKKLEKMGMVKCKPQHKAQINTYGYKFNVDYYLYMAVNKNTDALYIEFGAIDKRHGEEQVALANNIIQTTSPPERKFAEGHYKCNYCAAKNVCHFNEKADLNCRSCKNAKPVEDGKWFCLYHKVELPEDFIPTGCQSWESVDV